MGFLSLNIRIVNYVLNNLWGYLRKYVDLGFEIVFLWMKIRELKISNGFE